MIFIIPAELVPCSALPSKSIPQLCAAAHSVLPTSIRNMASWSTACRPKTSASCPKIGMNVVDVRVNAVTIQVSSSNLSANGEYFVKVGVRTMWGGNARKWDAMEGTAVATIVRSSVLRI